MNCRKLFLNLGDILLRIKYVRSSRSACSNLAATFRKKRYPGALVSKLSDSEDETAETQVWLDYSLECRYIKDENYSDLFQAYDHIIGKLVNMSMQPEKWTF